MFQYLIGWIQTQNQGDGVKRSKKFQYLIGWIQTIVKNDPGTALAGVSIPHRLDTNKSLGGLLN